MGVAIARPSLSGSEKPQERSKKSGGAAKKNRGIAKPHGAAHTQPTAKPSDSAQTVSDIVLAVAP